ncbi:hypothetical protein [Mumia zhuanghuii]|uniref:Uncharacterized protein n=1 Tax=Mumia zhuanghuii TaxID=2585211 RepID=A0A5C4MGH8_9ACTN|nr:hypothetical protein [Mumia zhuanghuii]TNC33516.1 hypothetical protein FHE65_28925 [Mumia zhuanghuii]
MAELGAQQLLAGHDVLEADEAGHDALGVAEAVAVPARVVVEALAVAGRGLGAALEQLAVAGQRTLQLLRAVEPPVPRLVLPPV